MKTHSRDYDVVVIGGGPAGATAASVVSMDGNRVLLLEKSATPQYKVGESLLPVTIHGISSFLGVKDQVDRAGFHKKYGGTFRWGTRKDLWDFGFGESVLQATGQELYSYQVERVKFDEILLNNTVKKGVDLQRGCTVTHTQLPDASLPFEDRTAQVTYKDRDGEVHTVSCAYIVDASGQRGC